MQFICEIVPSTFLTPLRRTLAQELSNLGYIQTEIATILGVSQPVVSTYLRAQVPQESSLITRPEFKELVSKLLSLIKNEKLTSFELMETICLECQKFRTAGPLCDIHRKNCRYDFSPDCNICFPSAEQSTIFDQKLQLIKELFEAAQQLVSFEERFGRLIPEIGCQFVSILEDSETPTDIAGFPGRIITVKGKGRVVAPPEFGQGATLAKILLFLQKQGSSYLFHARI